MIAFAFDEAPIVQEERALVAVEMRVTSSAPRAIAVDRGSVDGLALGDRVTFEPRDGSAFDGLVVRLGERVAVVEPLDPSRTAAPGTRARASVASDRLPKPTATQAPPQTPQTAPQPAPQAPPQSPPEPGATPPVHEPWTNRDEEWTQGDALLARVRPLQPSERTSRWTGRLYGIADHQRFSQDDRDSTFARLGGGAVLENAFGSGGELNIDGELNWRDVNVPDADGEEDARFRLDRLSYALGGDRFHESRFEVGRFLHHEFPELAVLDGVEWTRHFGARHRFGGSVGFLPEPDAEQETGDDLSLAAWYRYASDESERFTLGAAYQKTFHDLAADRDLVLLQTRYLPRDGWMLDATAWLDVYGSSDANKSSGVEPTQVVASVVRDFDSGTNLRLAYVHMAFPDVEQDAFPPVADAQIADDAMDRGSLDVRQRIGDSLDAFAGGGAWTDEDDSGFDAEAGLSARDIVFDGAFVDLSGFGADGRFTTVLGWRARVGHDSGSGRLSLGYEFAFNREKGFDSDNDDLPQHRVRLGWDWFGDGGFSFSGYGELLLLDEEHGIQAGIRLDRSF